MDSDRVAIERLVRLPIDFHERGNLSVIDLLNEYCIGKEFETGTITNSSVAARLEQDHSLIQVWLDWSADKRSSGWYFVERDDRWEVGHYSNGLVEQFDDAIVACAAFIQKELEVWRKVR